MKKLNSVLAEDNQRNITINVWRCFVFKWHTYFPCWEHQCQLNASHLLAEWGSAPSSICHTCFCKHLALWPTPPFHLTPAAGHVQSAGTVNRRWNQNWRLFLFEQTDTHQKCTNRWCRFNWTCTKMATLTLLRLLQRKKPFRGVKRQRCYLERQYVQGEITPRTNMLRGRRACLPKNP